MRILILATALGAVAVSASPAAAQHWRGNNREVRQEQRECQRELRRADSRREYQRELRECRREIAEARRHHNRWDYRRGYAYRDDRYRDGRYWDGYRWRTRY